MQWYTGHRNIIGASWRISRECEWPGGARTRNQVAFYHPVGFADTCGRNVWSACWYANNLDLNDSNNPGSIILRYDARIQDPKVVWSDPTPPNPNCNWLEKVMMHEAGHAFGLADGAADDSLTSAEGLHHRSLCGPSKYDVAAIMANYQSRTQ